MGFGTELLIIVGLTLLNGLFSGSEIALLSMRKTRLTELADEGRSSARAALRLRSEPERLLATVQVGITVIGASTSVFGGARLEAPIAAGLRAIGLREHAEPVSLVLVVALVSYLSLVLGELVPKSLALRETERMTLLVSRMLLVLSVLVRPLVWLLTVSSNLILRPFRDSTTFLESRVSPDELQALVGEAASSGTLSPVAGDIASRAIDLARLPVEAVMVPRPRMVTTDLVATAGALRAMLRTRRHARYPVLSEGERDVAGYVTARDLYEHLGGLADDATFDVARLARPMPFVPEGTPAVTALRTLQGARTQLGLVVDEQGVILGLLTIEDVAEELLGDILEEHEQPVAHIRPADDGSYVVRGDTPLHELARALDVDLVAKHGATTLAGLIIESAGHIPAANETVELADGLVATILEATPRQVRSVRLRLAGTEA